MPLALAKNVRCRAASDCAGGANRGPAMSRASPSEKRCTGPPNRATPGCIRTASIKCAPSDCTLLWSGGEPNFLASTESLSQYVNVSTPSRIQSTLMPAAALSRTYRHLLQEFSSRLMSAPPVRSAGHEAPTNRSSIGCPLSLCGSPPRSNRSIAVHRSTATSSDTDASGMKNTHERTGHSHSQPSLDLL